MENNKYFTVESIDVYEFSEIDLDLDKELFPEIDDYSSEEYDETNVIKIGKYWEVDGYPIQIDRMIEKLQEFKSKGANYVVLEYHVDHIGYPMEGLRIYPSAPEEIKSYEDKKKLESDKKYRKEKLIDELRKLDEDDN